MAQDQPPISLWGKLKRLFLGKTDSSYLRQITGGNSYWEKVRLDQQTWQVPAESDLAQQSSQFDAVYGLPQREVSLWLARNPELEPAYQTEVERRKVR
jgi:hypothetical protein